MTISLSRKILAAGAAVAIAGGAGAAIAADTATTVTVTPQAALKAGDTAPFDAPGVKAIRRGKAIPKGYELVGYRVQVSKGHKAAGAALRFTCPGAKRLRTFGVTGNAGFLADRRYAGHKSTSVQSIPDLRSTSEADGVLYAVCR